MTSVGGPSWKDINQLDALDVNGFWNRRDAVRARVHGALVCEQKREVQLDFRAGRSEGRGHRDSIWVFLPAMHVAAGCCVVSTQA